VEKRPLFPVVEKALGLIPVRPTLLWILPGALGPENRVEKEAKTEEEDEDEEEEKGRDGDEENKEGLEDKNDEDDEEGKQNDLGGRRVEKGILREEREDKRDIIFCLSFFSLFSRLGPQSPR